MPNHVTNILRFTGSDEQVKALFEAVKNDEHGIGSIDFNKVIPMPETIFRGNLGSEERELYGSDNWYDWSIEHWGTKWGTYNFDHLSVLQEHTFEAHQKLFGNMIQFDTAWAAPAPVIAELARQFPDVAIAHRWADEDIGFNVGEQMFEKGEVVDWNIPEGGSKEAYELAADTFDDNLEEMGFRLSEDGTTYDFVDYDPLPDNCISM